MEDAGVKNAAASGGIAFIEGSSSLDSMNGGAIGSIQTSDEEQIILLLESIQDVKRNSRNRIHDIETASIDYEIAFAFQNGETEAYTYRVYLSTKFRAQFSNRSSLQRLVFFSWVSVWPFISTYVTK